MAKVRPGDRAKTKRATGDPSFPMQTASQVASAIKLRGKGKTKSRARVLSLASSAVSRLLRAKKISARTATTLRNKIKAARAEDRK